jgi:hypothetical protein
MLDSIMDGIRGIEMKIRVHFSPYTMSILLVSGIGTIKLGEQNLSPLALSPRKADTYRKVFAEDVEYDLEPFFMALIKLRNIRMFDILSDQWIEDTVNSIRGELK